MSEWLDLETTEERRVRFARALAAKLDDEGYARFPLDGHPPTWDEERVKEARRALFQAIEDVADGHGVPARDPQFYELDGALFVEWAPPEDDAT